MRVTRRRVPANGILICHSPPCSHSLAVIIPFLWGSGEEPPLRYRLLPAASFAGGVHVYESRLREGLPLDPVVLHSGGLHGGQKHGTYERLGLFHSDFSLPARPAPGVGGTVSPDLVKQLEPEPGAAMQQDLLPPAGQMAPVAAPAAPRAILHIDSSSISTSVVVAAVLGLVCAAGFLGGLILWRRANKRPTVKGVPIRPQGSV